MRFREGGLVGLMTPESRERGAGLIVCTPSRSSNGPGVVRTEAATSENTGRSGRYGASAYPFDPGKRGSSIPIRRFDEPGTV